MTQSRSQTPLSAHLSVLEDPPRAAYDYFNPGVSAVSSLAAIKVKA